MPSATIDPEIDSVQLLLMTCGQPLNARIELLQGPNNVKQHLNLRCGGSTQPYHFVVDTPGPNWMMRLNSKKFLEDGLFEIAVAEYP